MKYLFANFKTNLTKKELINYFNEISVFAKQKNIVFFLNSFYSLIIHDLYPNLVIGNQSASELGLGAFTSSVSMEQLKTDGISNILLNHSEEIKYFNVTEIQTHKKLLKALELDLKVVLCFGNQIENNNYDDLSNQLFNYLKQILDGVLFEKFKNIILAYEPIFAIGTSKPISYIVANEIIKKIKEELFKNYNHKFFIVYGGSVDEKNINYFLNQKEIDGVLVGKAALDIDKMKQMINSLSYD